MTFDSSYTVRLLFIHSLAGLFGSPLPAEFIPSLNGSIDFYSYSPTDEFFSPGYISITSAGVYASSVRYYSDPYYEFTDTNTPIAKWRLFKYSSTDSYDPTGLTGDLLFSSSGWSLDRALPLDTGEYFFEYEFFDGSHTISHFSDTFSVGVSQFSHSPDNAIPTVLVFFLVLASLGLSVYLLKSRHSNSHTTNSSSVSSIRLSTRDYPSPKTSNDPHNFSVRTPAKFRRRRKY